MKIKKNFLKKLSAVALGFVMTLGVGAAGYAGAASETRAGTNTVVFTVTGWAGGTGTSYISTSTKGTGAVTNSTDTVEGYMVQYIPKTGQVRGNQQSVGSNWSMYNSTAIPGSITKIAIAGTGTWRNNLYCAVGTSSVSSQTDTSKGTNWSTSRDWSFNSSSNYKYFKLYSNVKFTSGNVTGVSVTVTYETAPVGYSITYNKNLPSGVTTNPTPWPSNETNKTSFTKPSNPSLSGYTFDGWYDAETGGTKYNGGETINAPLVLYAHWTPDKVLDHVALGGDLSKKTYTYGDSWSSNGLTLTAYYTDESSAPVAGSYSFNPATPSVGTSSVEITGTYNGESDKKSYSVTVNKATLGTPEPTYSGANKQITWPAVSNASSYQVKIGSGSYATATSPYDVSSYVGQGSKDFYIKAIGNSNYADSAEAHISFEVKAAVQYKLITDTKDLVAGCNYTIGNAGSGAVNFMSTTDKTNNRPQTANSISPSDGKYTASEDVLNLELSGSTGAWTFKTTNYEGTNGYLSQGNQTSSNYLKVVGNSDKDTWTISFDDSGNAVITSTKKSTRNLLRYNKDTNSGLLFACYTSGQQPVYLFKEVVTTPSAVLSASSLTNYKDLLNPNTDTTVTCTNFTPDGLTFSYADGGDASSTHVATSQNVEVSTGAAVSGVYTLSILCKKVGTTNVKIDVGGATLEPLYLNVTVNPKPGSITSNGFSKTETTFINKDSTSDSGSRLITPKLLDTDGNEMTSTPASDLFTFTVSDPTKHIQVNESGRVYGDGNASATATSIIVASVELPTVTAEFPVQAIADYITGTWNVGGSLTKAAYTAGEEFNPADLAITAKYFFAGIQTVPYSDLLFTTSNQGIGKANPYSFNNDDALGENATTIYVYYGNSDEPVGSVGNITVTPSDISMTGLAFKLTEEGEEVEETDMIRGEVLTLIPVFKPSNTTDSRTLEWTVEQDGSGISVDSTGKITVAADATVGNVGYITASTTFEDKDQITAEFMVTVLREEQKVHVVTETEEEWTKVTSNLEDWSGEFLIVSESTENGSVVSADVFNGRDETSDYVTYDVSNNKIVVGAEDVDPNTYKVTITKNNASGGNYFLQTANPADSTKPYFGRSSTSNGLDFNTTGYDTSISIDDGDATITPNDSVKFAFNNTSGQTRFRYYKNSTAEGNDYYLPQMYKKSGGTQEYDATVSDDLFEAVVEASSYLNDDWELVELALSDIIDASGEDLIILQHGVNLSTGNEVQKFLYNYDNLVVNSGKEDFLNRFVKHTVTFDSDGGSSIDPITVVEGAKVTKPADPTKTGYDFDNWYVGTDEFDFNTPIMADITLTAQWNEKSYNVSFSGSNITYTGNATCKYGSSYSATLSAATGYNLPDSLTVTCNGQAFTGCNYNKSTGAFSISSMPAGDIAISGSAVAINYSISYDLAGGSLPTGVTNPISYTITTETITLNNPTKEGNNFQGWFDANDTQVSQITKGSTGNISLTAHWSPIPYGVSFTGDNITFTGAATCDYGAKYTAKLEADAGYVLPSSLTVTCGGQPFENYSYDIVTGDFEIASMPAGAIAISGSATQGAYTIKYYEVGGTEISEPQLITSYEWGVGATLVAANNRTGYNFVGWYDNDQLSGNPVTSISNTATGNKAFYAKWAFAAQDALDNVQTSIGMSFTYQKDANAPIVSSSTVTNKVETKGTANSYHYEKVTSSTDLTNGNYLIVCENQNVCFKDATDEAGNVVTVTINDNQIAYTSELAGCEFAINVTNGTIYGSNSKYIGKSTNANGLDTNVNELTNTISINDSGNVDITGSGGAYLRCNPNSGSQWFRYYKSSTYTGQKAIQLYKVVEDKKEVTSIEIGGAPSTTKYNVGQAYVTNGLTVEAYYEGGSHEDVTALATITPSKLTAEAGDKQITYTASYEGLTDTSDPINVTVNSVYSNVSFKFNFKNTGMDALVSEYGDVYDDMGLVVEYDGRTRCFSFIPDQYGNYYIYEDGKEATTYKMKDGGMFTLSLGDMINDTNGRADITFTVKAYIRAGETYYYSENSASYSVKSWIEYYHSKSEYKDAIEDLYNIFFPSGK